MHPQVNQSPVASDLMEQLPRDAIVYDLIYTPSPTLFLRYAAAGGATIIDGTEMLIYQGAAALEQWIQQPAPIEVMRQALQQQLAG
jgi:shikimate dehydrogenase